MATFEWNKIIGSVLTALIIAMVTGIVATMLVQPRRLEKQAYPIAAAETAAPGAVAQAPTGPAPIGPYLLKADPAKGKQIAAVCLTCHTFEKGGPNRIGPNLWGVADEKIAAVPNYSFSPAISKHNNEKWDPELLNAWLDDPQKFADGTKMTFPGIPNEQQRADVIAYLETLTPGGAAGEKALAAKVAADEAKAQKSAAAAKPAAAAAKGPAKAPDISALLAKADPKKGEQIAQVCKTCHTFNKGGPNAIGPNLSGVVGGPIAEDRGGYQFSPALSQHKGGKWTPALLNDWLTDPQKFASGTKMTFPGLPSAQQRADVISYLESLK